MLDLLGAQLGLQLNPATIAVPSGERVEVDGADANRTVLVECWAHQGPPKSAQKHKVLADAFKLAWIATTIYPRPQLVLCLSDPQAAAPFLPGGRTWASRALQDHLIGVRVVALPGDLHQRLLEAQHRSTADTPAGSNASAATGHRRTHGHTGREPSNTGRASRKVSSSTLRACWSTRMSVGDWPAGGAGHREVHAARKLPDVTVVADAGMISGANQFPVSGTEGLQPLTDGLGRSVRSRL
jgi:hypothetical protein